MDVSVPPGTTAEVYVPAEDLSLIREGRRPASQAQGVKFLRMHGAEIVLEVKSGDYHFRVVPHFAK